MKLFPTDQDQCGADVAKTLKEVGVITVNSDGTFKSLQQILTELTKKWHEIEIKEEQGMNVRNRLEDLLKDLQDGKTITYLVTFIELEDGNIEMITNTSDFIKKVQYYLNAYDLEMCHLHNCMINMVDFIAV